MFQMLLCFLKEHLEDISPFCGATDTHILNFWWHLPWVSKQGESPWFVLHHLHAMDSSDSPLVQHLLTSWQPAWQPSCFNPWGSNPVSSVPLPQCLTKETLYRMFVWMFVYVCLKLWNVRVSYQIEPSCGSETIHYVLVLHTKKRNRFSCISSQMLKDVLCVRHLELDTKRIKTNKVCKVFAIKNVLNYLHEFYF